MQTFALDPMRLESLLREVSGVRALVVGDVCLDVYWIADMRRSTLSRETPHHNMPVVEERYALGGAGNVMNNMAALGAKVWPATALGNDWRGGIVRTLMQPFADRCEAVVETAGRVTPTYIKPYRCGYGELRYEDPRLDFENVSPLQGAAEEALIAKMRAAAAQVDVIAVSDQMSAGVITPRMRETLSALAEAGKTVIVDSRENIVHFAGCIVKPNELESARAVNMAPSTVSPQDYLPVADALMQRTGKGVIITLGAMGAMCMQDEEACFVPGEHVPPPVDIVGAGDSFLSACALALGAGATMPEAVALGNLAAAVTIQKLGQTGTASAEEIRAQYEKRGQ